MNLEILLFSIVSFSSALLYYVIADKANWTQRSVKDFETSYWNAFQILIWSLGAIMLRNGPTPSIWSTIPILPTTILYGLISEQPGMDFDLTGNRPLTGTQIAVLSTVGVFVFLYIVVLLYNQDYTNPVGVLWNFVPLLIFIVWMLTWLGVNKESTTTTTSSSYQPGGYDKFKKKYIYGGTMTNVTTSSYSLHIHHWMIGMIGFLLSKDPAMYSQIMSGIFWGIFCQEASAYGIAIPSDPRQTVTSTFQESDLGPGGTHM